MTDTPFDIPLRGDLKERRQALGLSQAEFAEEIGGAASTITHWEAYHSTPNLENA